LDEHAPDYDQVLVELAALLERLALTQLVPDSSAESGFDPGMLAELAARITAADLQLYYQIALVGRRDLELAPEPRIGFEMTLLRMLAFRPASGTREEPEARAAAGAPGRPAPGAAPAAGAESAPGGGGDDWQQLVARLDISGAARQLAANCVWLGRAGDTVRLRLDRRSEGVRTGATEERLAQALARHFGAPVRLVI